MNKVFIKYWQEVILIIGIIAFILIELPLLNRPFYWDEAWSYASGIKAMFENGPSLMPGAIHEYLYRGHPTFFYFITTVWMKVFGSSLISIHTFFLLISTGSILFVFYFGKRFSDKTGGLIAAICLVATPVFLSQAGFMLPEIMLAFFGILTMYYYLENKYFPEIVFGSLLLLTKETGLVLIGTLILTDLVFKIRQARSLEEFWKNCWSIFWHFIPLGIVGIFFIIQKIKFGWFF